MPVNNHFLHLQGGYLKNTQANVNSIIVGIMKGKNSRD